MCDIIHVKPFCLKNILLMFFLKFNCNKTFRHWYNRPPTKLSLKFCDKTGANNYKVCDDYIDWYNSRILDLFIYVTFHQSPKTSKKCSFFFYRELINFKIMYGIFWHMGQLLKNKDIFSEFIKKKSQARKLFNFVEGKLLSNSNIGY